MKDYNNILNLLGWVKEQQSMTLLISGLNIDSMINKDRMQKHMADFNSEISEDNTALYNWMNMGELEEKDLRDIFSRRVESLEGAEGDLLRNQDALLTVLLHKSLSQKGKADIEAEYQLVSGRIEIINRGLGFYIDCLYS